MNDRRAYLLDPVSDDARQVTRILAQLGEADGEYLHHVVQTLLERHGNPLTGGVALLIALACAGTVPEQVLRFAAAIQIVEVAGLAHRQILQGDPLVPAEQPAIDLQLIVLAGDYLYSQASFITAGLRNLTVMRLLAEVIKQQCMGEVLRERDAGPDGMVYGLYSLAVLGTAHLIGCEQSCLEDLARFARVMSGEGDSEQGLGGVAAGRDCLFAEGRQSALRDRLVEIAAALQEQPRSRRGAPEAAAHSAADAWTDRGQHVESDPTATGSSRLPGVIHDVAQSSSEGERNR